MGGGLLSSNPMTFSQYPSELTDDLTDDALTDRVRILQRRNGHRYSVDDVATAWIALRASDPEARSCLDLGCGIGSVLMMVADRFQQARVVGVEAQAGSYALAERNIERNRLGKRASVQFGDLRDTALLDRILQAEAAFGRESGFDLVTGTPPYKPLGTASLSPDPQRAHARVELRGGVEAYMKAAVRVLEPQGLFVMCAQSDLAPRIAKELPVVGLTPIYRLDVIPRFARKSRLFSVHVFVRDTAADGGRAALARLIASSDPLASREVDPLAPLPGTDVDCGSERLVLRDEAGERTPESRTLRAFFGLFDQEKLLPCSIPALSLPVGIIGRADSDSVG
jgi:tRNA1Val (adenine37-N6)-methyltransferase